MLGSLLTKTLRDQRRALLWWAFGLCALSVWTIGWYRTYARSAAELTRFFERAPAALKAFFGGELDMGTPAGYLRTELFSLMVPLLLIIFALGAGARALAGEERAGTLDVLLTEPVTRARVVLEKFGAIVLATMGLAAVLSIAILAAAFVTGMDIARANVMAVVLQAALLAIVYASLSLAVGAATGSRGASVGIASALAVAGYLLYGLSGVATSLRPWRWISPFTYYAEADVVKNGTNGWHAAVLAGLAIVFTIAAVLAFDRRDVRT